MTDPAPPSPPPVPVPPAGAGGGAAPAVPETDAARPPRRRRRRWIAAIVSVLVLAALGAGAVVGVRLWTEANERALAARIVSAGQQSAVEAAFAATDDTAAEVRDQRDAYAQARGLWDATAAAVDTWKADAETPSVQVENPGGAGLPGGDADARALLEGIGAGDVQIVYDAGAQNCGFAAAAGQYGLALGGCYDSAFRTSIFLAWDAGIGRDQIWPIFVHEAMHWYQWDRYAQLFTLAGESGVADESYRAQIESDASCRAVNQHGIAASAYAGSSAPCDVADWHDGWLVEQLAGLGVPVTEPDVADYEVGEVVRP
jgi:hypothetical protein